MKLNINVDNLKEMGRQMNILADDWEVSTENLKWELDLSTADLLMLNKAKHDFKLKTLGMNEEEFKSYAGIAITYRELEEFYDHDNLERKKRDFREGYIKPEDVKYDLNITIEEAYERYSKYDRETSRKVSDQLYDVNRKANLYEKDIRLKYTGDLASQLGYNRAEFERDEEEYNQAAAKFMEALNRCVQKNPEKQQAFNQSIGNYNDFVNQTVESYEASQEGPGFTR